MNQTELAHIIAEHGKWLRGEGGKRADLYDADLADADLAYANLAGANMAGASMYRANLAGANMASANMAGANLIGAFLSGADMARANLSGADLRCTGNMREIRTMQIDKWKIGYTADTLQIGCQRHPIAKWRRWDSDAGRKWIDAMDGEALEWAERNLALVLSIIDANPATPTGHEVENT